MFSQFLPPSRVFLPFRRSSFLAAVHYHATANQSNAILVLGNATLLRRQCPIGKCSFRPQ